MMTSMGINGERIWVAMVKSIYLNTGEEVLVDDEDYPVVVRYSWRKVSQKHYAGTTIRFPDGTERTMYMHQLILATSTHVDHEDFNVWNNQKDNIRPATRSENNWNKPKQKSSKGKPCTSQYKGVSLIKGKWRAQIKRAGVLYRLGEFYNEEDAAEAYNKKAKELSGDFIWLNPLPKEYHSN